MGTAGRVLAGPAVVSLQQRAVTKLMMTRLPVKVLRMKQTASKNKENHLLGKPFSQITFFV